MRTSALTSLLWTCAALHAGAQSLAFDDTPARPGEWGFRPGLQATVRRNPPSFAWRPQQGAVPHDHEGVVVERVQTERRECDEGGARPEPGRTRGLGAAQGDLEVNALVIEPLDGGEVSSAPEVEGAIVDGLALRRATQGSTRTSCYTRFMS